jgi:hypothetical protein
MGRTEANALGHVARVGWPENGERLAVEQAAPIGALGCGIAAAQDMSGPYAAGKLVQKRGGIGRAGRNYMRGHAEP